MLSFRGRVSSRAGAYCITCERHGMAQPFEQLCEMAPQREVVDEHQPPTELLLIVCFHSTRYLRRPAVHAKQVSACPGR